MNYLTKAGIEEIASVVLEKIIKGTGQVLSSTEINEVTPSFIEQRNIRIQACKNILIKYIFSEQGESQIPEMKNRYKSFKGYGYSLYDVYYKAK